MKGRDSSRVQDQLINRLERQEKRNAFQRDRFFRLKIQEIHNQLSQALLMKKIVETDDPSAISESLLQGLKRATKTSDFDFNYFIAPIRTIVSKPNPYSLYMTQYIMEVLLDDPHVIEVYGTDQDIYKAVNEVITKITLKFERDQEEVLAQIANNKSLVQGTREYEIALEQAMRKRLGEPPPDL